MVYQAKSTTGGKVAASQGSSTPYPYSITLYLAQKAGKTLSNFRKELETSHKFTEIC